MSRGINLLPVKVELPVSKMVVNPRNPARDCWLAQEVHLPFIESGSEVVRQVFQQLRLGPDRGVAYAGYKELTLVKDTQQIYYVGFRNVVHFLV